MEIMIDSSGAIPVYDSVGAGCIISVGSGDEIKIDPGDSDRVSAKMAPVTPRRLRSIADAIERAENRGHSYGILACKNGCIGFLSLDVC